MRIQAHLAGAAAVLGVGACQPAARPMPRPPLPEVVTASLAPEARAAEPEARVDAPRPQHLEVAKAPPTVALWAESPTTPLVRVVPPAPGAADLEWHGGATRLPGKDAAQRFRGVEPLVVVVASADPDPIQATARRLAVDRAKVVQESRDGIGFALGRLAFATGGTSVSEADLPLALLLDRCGNVLGATARGLDQAAEAGLTRALLAIPKPTGSCPVTVPPATVVHSPTAGVALLEPVPQKPGEALAFVRPGEAKSARVVVDDARLSIPAAAGHSAAKQGAPLSFQGKPVLLSIGATWCQPCIEELPDLLVLAARIRDKAGGELCLVSVDGGTGGPAGLWNAFERLRERAAEAHPGIPSPVFPAWATLRGDPKGAWIALVDHFFAADSRVRESGIPLNLLFDGCGRLHLVVQERIDPATSDRLVATAEKLAAAGGGCPASPVTLPGGPK
jgi:thiol-disulfide isomerase/thioredoxin